MTFNILLLTGEQIRAARALARIEQTELARRASLSLETIKRLERIRGPVEANARTLRAIQRAFEAIGVIFVGDETGTVGVKRRLTETQPSVATERLRRLIYHGQLVQGAAPRLRPALAALHDLTLDLHQGLGLTGLTLVLDGCVLQALEGERDAVEVAYRRLGTSTFQDQMHLLDDSPAGQRIFPDMGFCCGLFPSDLRPDSEGPGLALPFRPERLSASEAMGVLMKARKLQMAQPRNNCLVPAACALSALCMDPRCSDQPQPRRISLTPQAH